MAEGNGAEYLAGKRAYIEKGCAKVVELALDGLGSEALEALAMVRDKGERASMPADATKDAVRRAMVELEAEGTAKDSAAGAYADMCERLSDAWQDPPA